MAYYLNLFSPETYEAFKKSSQDVSGFRKRQENAARQIKKGDRLICYMTKLSRWFGVFVVESDYFIDETPIFYPDSDPFKVRFKVKPLILLPVEKAIPIREDYMWNKLTFTRGLDKKGSSWTGKLRNSLNRLEDEDGMFIEEQLRKQERNGNITDFEGIINPTFLPKNKLERIIVEPTDPRGEPLPEQLLA